MSPALRRRFDHLSRPVRSRAGPAVLLVLACLLVLTGCLGPGNINERPRVPDQSVLEPANQALDQAVQANAEEFAPRAIDSARRRITLARDILFTAARERREPNADEHKRIDVLVDQAKLDAREALVETQAKAVDKQLGTLEQSDTQSTGSNPMSPSSGIGGARGTSARTGLSSNAVQGN